MLHEKVDQMSPSEGVSVSLKSSLWAFSSVEGHAVVLDFMRDNGAAKSRHRPLSIGGVDLASTNQNECVVNNFANRFQLMEEQLGRSATHWRPLGDFLVTDDGTLSIRIEIILYGVGNFRRKHRQRRHRKLVSQHQNIHRMYLVYEAII